MLSLIHSKSLDNTAKVLIRCSLMNYALVLLWFVLFAIGKDRWWFQIQTKTFDVSNRDLGLITYYGIAFIKICNIIFFLFPYIAIRMVLKMKR